MINKETKLAAWNPFWSTSLSSYKIWLLISAKVCNAISDNLYTCCTSSKQCDLNQGDCDSHDECSGNLSCGEDNCQSPFPSDADCCYLGKFFTLDAKPDRFLHKIQCTGKFFWCFVSNLEGAP